ncbi:hypothetical protein SCMU_36240 [Sinomonas cyclohexanicum]|uniref:Uncharacterized protein n=1 Tax=Sinomonas cyclohexanicum TaxID=322009 RepID=A0ABM7PZQ3_SINCY|nr:hypothetical protein SCMU_36240 [Corynebacterium cyclohexanicum]
MYVRPVSVALWSVPVKDQIPAASASHVEDVRASCAIMLCALDGTPSGSEGVGTALEGPEAVGAPDALGDPAGVVPPALAGGDPGPAVQPATASPTTTAARPAVTLARAAPAGWQVEGRRSITGPPRPRNGTANRKQGSAAQGACVCAHSCRDLRRQEEAPTRRAGATAMS